MYSRVECSIIVYGNKTTSSKLGQSSVVEKLLDLLRNIFENARKLIVYDCMILALGRPKTFCRPVNNLLLADYSICTAKIVAKDEKQSIRQPCNSVE